MSYQLSAYLVNLAEIRAIVGSKDRSTLARLERELAKLSKERGNSKTGQPSRDAPGVLTSLRRIFRGEVEPPDSPERLRHGAYNGYALEFICRSLGRKLPNDQFQDVHSSFLDAVGIIAPLVESAPPLPLTNPRDFPFVHHLPARAVKQELGRLRQLNLSGNVEVAAGQLQYLSWLAEGTFRKKDLVASYA